MLRELFNFFFPKNDNPKTRSNKEIKDISKYNLERGKFVTVKFPNFSDYKNHILTQWYIKSGDLVSHGDIVCEIEGDEVTMEFETFYNGRITLICSENQKIESGTKLFTIEGV